MANQKISQLDPIGTIDPLQDSFVVVDYSENLTKRTNLENIGQRVLAANDTDDLSEGSTNLYFTDTRVYSKVKASLIAGDNTSITFDDDLQTITIASQGNVQSVNGETGAVTLDTDDISEGAVNFYYTDAKVEAVLTAQSVTKQGNTFNGASELVQLDADSKLPAVDGSNLTNLPISPSTGGDLYLFYNY